MALRCDLRVASRGATFGCFERRFDVPLVDGSTQRLSRVVGLGRTLDVVLTGRVVDAETAERWGLATRLVPEGETLSRAVELGDRIAAFPQVTLLTDRSAVYDGGGTPLQQGLGLEGWHGSRPLRTAREGAARFAGGEGRGGAGVEDREP